MATANNENGSTEAPMNKRIGLIFISIIAITFLTGMGSLQGPATPGTIPKPAKNYSVLFVDQMDNATECNEASIEGTTFLEGKRGEGTLTVSFDNIDQISFRLNAERLTGLVKHRDGETSEITLDKSRKAYGRTKYGTFQIRLSDLKKMVIRPASAR
jgi:hypothetical protein